MVRLVAALVEPTRSKRTVIALVAFAVLAFAAMTVRATIGVESARSEVEQRLEALTGLSLRLAGPGSTRLWPWPGVRFDDVTLSTAGDGRVLARMDALDLKLDVAALLLGRLAADELRLVRPDMRLALGAGRPGLDDLAGRLAAWQPATVVVDKGRLTLRPGTAGEEVIDGLDARFSWPRPSANVTISAGFRWRGETVAVEGEAPSPARLFGTGPEPWSLRLVSQPLRLSLSGVGGPRVAARFDGSIDVDVTDAARFGRWTGWPGVPDLLAGRLRLDGRIGADATTLTMPAARVDLAGNKGEGALTLTWDKARPRLGGTIAFTEMDFTAEKRRPYGAGWRVLPLGTLAEDLDLDLRLSTPSLRLPSVTFTRVAGALHLAEGRIHAEIGEAQFFEKPLSMVVRGTVGRDGLRAQVRGNGDDLPAAAVADLLELPGVEAGSTAIALEAETRCRELGACLVGLDGRLSLDVRGAAVTGASPFADISRFRPIVPQSNGTRVTATWERFGAELRLRGPAAEVTRVEIVGQGARFLFAGTGDLATGAVDLAGHAYFPAFRPDPSRTGTSEVAVPMRIGGTLRRLEAMARDAAPIPGTPPKGATEPTAPAVQ